MDISEWLYAQGPFGIGILIFGYLYARKYITTGRETRQLELELAREREERDLERQELRKELAFWRDLAWTASKLADHVVGVLPGKKDVT
jgi:uncharacterized membrane-anchored protein YhcB (DUF1043 family)